MTNEQYTAIIDYMYANDCWFGYACDALGFGESIAKQAAERFDRETAA